MYTTICVKRKIKTPAVDKHNAIMSIIDDGILYKSSSRDRVSIIRNRLVNEVDSEYVLRLDDDILPCKFARDIILKALKTEPFLFIPVVYFAKNVNLSDMCSNTIKSMPRDTFMRRNMCMYVVKTVDYRRVGGEPNLGAYSDYAFMYRIIALYGSEPKKISINSIIDAIG